MFGALLRAYNAQFETRRSGMKIAREAAVALFVALGMKTASEWSDARLISKLKKLPETMDEGAKIEDEDSKKLLKGVLKALEAEEDIEITAEEKADKKKDKPAKEEKKASKKAKAEKEEEEEDEEDDDDSDEDDDEESDDDDEDEEDDDDEEEEPAKKSKKDKKADKKSSKKEESDDDEEEEEDEVEIKKSKKKDGKKGKRPEKAGGKDGPGVIGSIIEFIQAASKKEPITKQEMADKLAKRFKDRDRDAMMKTINVQVPNRLNKDKKLNVVKHEKGGYYISKKKDE
jgi:hypothetical protein